MGMNREITTKYKVAIITESLWKMAGANKVLEALAEVFPQADIYALFGEKDSLSASLKKHNIYYSFLNKVPFIKYFYRYTLHLWPMAVEQFDLSEYDLIISNTSSVSHGVITPPNSKHVLYINSPMRYIWDLQSLYFDVVKFGFLKRAAVRFLLVFSRMWDVVAAQRGRILISNSNFTAKRVEKYWDRKVDKVIYPPVNIYRGKVQAKRENYYLAGAPFEPNKRGDFLLKCASEIGFNIKIMGTGSMKKGLKKKYRKFKNIEIVDWVSEKEKWELISNAKGFVVAGIEDYGIFCVEALSCGTPVLAYKGGGSVELIKENITGIFFDDWEVEDFKKALDRFENKKWDYMEVAKNLINMNSKEEFKKEIEKILVE